MVAEHVPHYHAVVWMDHHEARIVYFNADDAEEKTVRPPHPPRHLHHKAGSPAGTHVRGDTAYFRSIADAIGDAGEFLVAGPSTAKTEFLSWLKAKEPSMLQRLAGAETLPKMTDRQLVAEARRFFDRADRMKPQIS